MVGLVHCLWYMAWNRVSLWDEASKEIENKKKIHFDWIQLDFLKKERRRKEIKKIEKQWFLLLVVVLSGFSVFHCQTPEIYNFNSIIVQKSRDADDSRVPTRSHKVFSLTLSRRNGQI